MSRLEIQWPDAAAERARAARGRLIRAGEGLRARSFEDRLASVARVLSEWTRADSVWRRELERALAATTPFSQGAIAEGLESALRAWEPGAFVECARREVGPGALGEARTLAPYEWTTVIAGGPIPMPTLLSALIPLVVGSPVLLRETEKDPITASVLRRSIAAQDPELAACCEPLAFPHDDAAAYEILLTAPCVVATGSDEALGAISARLGPTTRFVGYGHRFSIAILGPRLCEGDLLERAAEGLALDVARWDQMGCLSAVVVYLLGVDTALAEQIAERVSDALARLEDSMPRGSIETARAAQLASERAEARMRVATSGGRLLEGRGHTVVLEADAQARPAPLGRFLRLMPVSTHAELLERLTPFAGQLSSVAIAGLAEENSVPDPRSSGDLPLLSQLSHLGVSRITEPGRLQTPPVDWPHDGLPLFTPLARMLQRDAVRL